MGAGKIKKIKTLRAVLFDMDGVLIDSEFHWTKIEKEFAGRNGLRYDERYRRRIMALSPVELARVLKKEFRVKKSLRRIIAERDRLASIIYRRLAKPLPGAVSLLKKCRCAGLKTALVSSSPHGWINPVLSRFRWRKFFDAVISAQDIKGGYGKPHPAIYLLAAKKLGVRPKDCLVFEDSINGVKAAKAAGMFCIAAPDKRWAQGKRGLGRADLIVKSLNDEKIKKLFIYALRHSL